MGLSYIATNPSGQRWAIAKEKVDYRTDYPVDASTTQAATYQTSIDNYIRGGGKDGKDLIEMNKQLAAFQQSDQDNKAINKNNDDLNKENAALNAANANKNAAYDQVIKIANNTKGSDYVDQRQLIRNLTTGGNAIDATTLNDLEASFKTFYKQEKLSTWDPDTAVKPPSPDGLKQLDTKYYAKQVPEAAKEWADAKENDNIDIIGRYNNSSDDFYNAHYAQQGKINGIRGYEAQLEDNVNKYAEELTKADTSTLLGGAGFDNLLTRILGPKEIEETKKYGALAQNVLKDAKDELIKAKAKENSWDLYKGLGSMSEIMNINKTLAESIMGDSGVGGYLGMLTNKSESDVTTDFEKQLGKITGVQNNVTYNWQKWFDDTLTQKYGIDYKEFQGNEDALDIVNAALKTTDENNQIDVSKIYDDKNKKFTDAFIKKAGFNTSEELVTFLGKQGPTGAELLTNLQVGLKEDLTKTTTDLTNKKTTLEQNIKTLEDTKNRNLKLKYTDTRELTQAEDRLELATKIATTDISKVYDKTKGAFKDTFARENGFTSGNELRYYLSQQGELGTTLINNIENSSTETTDTLKKLKENLQGQITEFKKAPVLTEELEIEASFARQFIDDYLKPRFDYSKSMEEFIDYMDIKENEKTPFTTTDRLTEMKLAANIQASNLQPEAEQGVFNVKEFNANFYFNPEDKYAPQKQDIYAAQKKLVEGDWARAKENPDSLINPDLPALGTWADNAYLYGIPVKDLEDKNTFAKLHYEIIGSKSTNSLKRSLDAAKDPTSVLQEKLETPLYSKAQTLGTVFGEFIKPEEFANKIIEAIDPLKNKESWKKILEQYGFDENTSIEEFKKAITDSLTTGTAEQIRSNIKFLQEEEKVPTQAELGVSYIERPEGKGTGPATKTELYNVFKKAGYQGTEESFYNDYMPDSSPEDIKLLTDITKGKMPELDLSFDTSDPMAALGKLEDLNEPTPIIKTKKPDSYFDLNLDDEEDTSFTSPTSFLSDFTALLKK
jgi:hypothetical protein